MTDALSGRLARWSQRKAAARRGDALEPEADETAAAVAPAEDQQVPDPTPEAANAATDSDAVAADEDLPNLPPIEELTFQSDYTVFLKKNVPEALRRAALRKLWQSDPVLANLDGLNDYDEDYHLVDTSITAAQTAYKVGKGYLEDIEGKVAQLANEGEGGESPRSRAESGERDDESDVASSVAESTDEQQIAASSPPETEHDSEAIAVPEDVGK
jgi:Protein of unknown function (DUF3306)